MQNLFCHKMRNTYNKLKTQALVIKRFVKNIKAI